MKRQWLCKSLFALHHKLCYTLFRSEPQQLNLQEVFLSLLLLLYMRQVLTAVLNDMVKKVEVHAVKKIDGQRTQKIDIYYDLVGYLPLSLLTPNSKTA